MEALDKALGVAAAIRDERNEALEAITRDVVQNVVSARAGGQREACAAQPAELRRYGAPPRAPSAARKACVYVIDRQFTLPLGDWVNQVRDVRNRFAAEHKLPLRPDKFDWQDAVTLRTSAADRELIA